MDHAFKEARQVLFIGREPVVALSTGIGDRKLLRIRFVEKCLSTGRDRREVIQLAAVDAAASSR